MGFNAAGTRRANVGVERKIYISRVDSLALKCIIKFVGCDFIMLVLLQSYN